MRFKLLLMVAAALVVPVAAVSSELKVMGLGFVAPQVDSLPGTSVANPHQGEIVFHDSSGSGTGGNFYGFDGTSWNQFGSSGSSTVDTAYVKEIYGNGVDAGGCTASNWQQRTLNTLEGATSFISLNSNQITLSAGTYDIDATAPAYFISWHQAKLRNVTDSTDAIMGTTEYLGNNQGKSRVAGRIVISASKTFELQHRCSVTRGTDGFGTAAGWGGVNDKEVYSIVKITKLQ